MKTFLQILVFLSLGVVCAQQVQQWSQLPQWHAVDNGLDGPVRSLLPDSVNNRLMIGGEFFYVNGNLQPSLASWDGSGLTSAGPFQCNPNFALGKWQGSIFATDCNTMFMYQNGLWNPVGSGFDGSGLCYYDADSVLFVGGGFNSINSQTASGLAVWNGFVWRNIPLPYAGGSVLDIAIIGNFLYIVGQFPDSIGETLTKILRFGCGCAGWTDISTPVIPGSAIAGSSAWAASLEVYNGELYAAGSFAKADGSIGNSIARYDGAQWHDVSDGISQSGSYGQVFCLHVFNGMLYVGGFFQYAGGTSGNGGVAASNIAAWDGSNWYGLGGQFDQSIMAIANWNNELYIGGRFTVIDTLPANYIAKYY